MRTGVAEVVDERRAGPPRRAGAGRKGGAVSRREASSRRWWAVRVRRLRGGVLRLTRSRPAGFAVGLGLLAPSLATAAADFPWENWLTDGLGLVGLATGAALIAVSLGGRRPDWIEPA